MIADLAAWAAATPLRPYDNIETAPFPDGVILERRVRALADTGYSKLGETVRVGPDTDFDTGNRQFRFLLHAWDPLALLLHAHGETRSLEPLRLALAYAQAWLQRFALSDLPAGELIAASRAGALEAWEGMATGHRLNRLAFLADAAARAPGIGDDVASALWASLERHRLMLADDRFFQGWNNHGLYQALGQLADAVRFEGLLGQGPRTAALERLQLLLQRHFDDEGVHLEHSPTYHMHLLGSLLGARASGLFAGSEVERTIASAERALAWMIAPSRRLVPFGDSYPSVVARSGKSLTRHGDPWLRHLASGGGAGTAPSSGVRGYGRAGYAFARVYDEEIGQDPSTASYLAHAAGFHSRTHKHADHLAVSWSEGEIDILVEPGRYGYLGQTRAGDGLFEDGFWYDDPKRVYVESTRAHNCVEVDGLNHARRDVTPFGSGLVQAEEQGRLAILTSRAPLRASVSQRRTLVLSPGRFLLVFDHVSDAEGHPHAVRQWFHLDGGWTASHRTRGYQAQRGLRRLHVDDLTGQAEAAPVSRGATEPRLQGWVSTADRTLQPASSLCLTRAAVGDVAMATLFSLGGEGIDGPTAAIEADGGAAEFTWRHEGRHHELSLRMRPDGGFSTVYGLRRAD